MLDPKSLDLDELCAALEDHSPEASWWIHTGDGRIQPERPTGEGWLEIGSVGSHEGYRDMAEFVGSVHHRRAAELLDRAISGRGAFRRFKDTLFEFPELREQWFRYRDARAAAGRCAGWPSRGWSTGGWRPSGWRATPIRTATTRTCPPPSPSTSGCSTATGCNACCCSASGRAEKERRSPTSRSWWCCPTCAHPGTTFASTG